MSRTDAHTPFRVRRHRGELAARAVHASDHAACDLPERPPLTSAEWEQTRCRWEMLYTGVNVCSCLLCHAGAEAHRANRRSRQRDRRQLGEALKAWRGGAVDGFDHVSEICSRRDYW